MHSCWLDMHLIRSTPTFRPVKQSRAHFLWSMGWSAMYHEYLQRVQWPSLSSPSLLPAFTAVSGHPHRARYLSKLLTRFKDVLFCLRGSSDPLFKHGLLWSQTSCSSQLQRLYWRKKNDGLSFYVCRPRGAREYRSRIPTQPALH
jgi:hypothetical protein